MSSKKKLGIEARRRWKIGRSIQLGVKKVSKKKC